MIKDRVEKNSFEDLDMDSADESLLRASGVAGSMTMFSRVLGLIRDIVIARIFGVTDAADAFFLANKIPNFLRRLFAEGAFNQAFVPVLSEYRTTNSHGEVLVLINSVAASLGGFLFLLVAVVVLAAPWNHNGRMGFKFKISFFRSNKISRSNGFL